MDKMMILEKEWKAVTQATAAARVEFNNGKINFQALYDLRVKDVQAYRALQKALKNGN